MRARAHHLFHCLNRTIFEIIQARTKMKKSKTITLILLTGALCVGCEDKVRNRYSSWDDCVNDYKESKGCREEKEKDHTGVVRTYYYGPWYGASRTGNVAYNPSVTSHRSSGIVRGGWGSTGSHAGS
jgi:hypothetical protein